MIKYILTGGRIKLFKGLFFSPLLLILIASAVLGNYMTELSVSWISALLHEAAHIYAMKKLGISVSGVFLQPFGVCAELKNPVIKNPGKEILIALAGPLCSLLLWCILCIIQRHYNTPVIEYAKNTNLALCIINLLPCMPLDGGRIMRGIITLCSDALTGMELSIKISRIISIVIIAAAIWLLVTSAFNFSLIMIGAFLLGNLCYEQKYLTHQTLKELLYYKEKPEADSLNNACILTAYETLPARKLLRRLSYHKYYIIHVMDKDCKIIRTLTEGQIINALLNESIKITLGEI